MGFGGRGAARLTGRPADRVLGKTFWTAFPTAKATHVERVLQDVLHDGEPRTYLAPAQALGSTGTFFETRVTLGPQNQLILLLRDVRAELPSESRAAQILTAFEEERRLYAQLFSLLPIPGLVLSVDGQILDANPEADRLSQLGSLVSGVAHELNNPLAAIAAFAEVLRADTAKAQLREAAEVIQTEALRAGRVVQTLLDFARQRPHVRQPVDVKDVVARVVALHRSALKKARVQAIDLIPSDVPAVTGDAQELQQVLLNALVNAEQAIAATGRPGKVAFSSRRTDDRLVILVEDTGPGGAPEILDRVVEPLFPTKGDQGTGLGLSISYGLVKGMGGRMYIVNVEGGGASLV